jgi:hypothetical protein
MTLPLQYARVRAGQVGVRLLLIVTPHEYPESGRSVPRSGMLTRMERADLEAWVDRYEQVWRTPGTDRLGELFTTDVVYRASPWADTARGLDALRVFWEDQRDGADEVFTMRSEIVAVDGATGVVRVAVDYGSGDSWLDVWIVRFAADGRVEFFEEWPLAPTPK